MPKDTAADWKAFLKSRCPTGELVHDAGQPGAAALGQDDPVRPGAHGAAEDGAQVVRVADLAAGDEEVLWLYHVGIILTSDVKVSSRDVTEYRYCCITENH